MRQEDQFQNSFCFLQNLYMMSKPVVCSLLSIYIDSPQLGIQLKQTAQDHETHFNYQYCSSMIRLEGIDPQICSILTFQKRVWEQFLHHILWMIFQEKCFLCYILLTDKISLPHCLYFSRYWAIRVLQLFASQVMKS